MAQSGEPASAASASDEQARRDAEASAREEAAARQEGEALRRVRDKADRLAEREAALSRRDADQADRVARKDAERARRDAARLETQQHRVVDEARKEADRQRAERERQARDAATAAGKAQREAESAERAAALARQRAEREVARARRHAERVDALGDEDETADEGPDFTGLPADIAVLWRRPALGRRGPRPGLSLERIADAAIALADAEGIEAVSMARLAESLGFTTMSLYRYVSSKDEVLMLMSDRVSGRPPAVGPEVGDWRARLEVLLALMQSVVGAHPWMSRAASLLFAIGPNRLEWMEALTAALEDTGLTEGDKLQAVGVLSSYQLEWARVAAAEAARVQAAAGGAGDGQPAGDGHPAGDDGRPNAPIERLVDPARQPALARAVAAGVFAAPAPDAARPPEGTLNFGTVLILDGIAALVARSRT